MRTKTKDKKIFDYSIDADSETLHQFKDCYSEDFVTAAALMPDAHKGYSAPIGAVLITKGKIVPAWVGYDIGCGLIAVRIKGKDILKKIQDNKQKIYSEVMKTIPMGVGEYQNPKNLSEKTKQEFKKLIEKFQKGPYDKDILHFLKNTSLKHLGTLGGGNHFIEIGFYKKEVWLIIHSGSRGIGHRVAKRYMIKASNSKDNFERTFPLDVNSQLGKEYLNILDFGLEYALLNRLEISYKVIESLEKVLNEKLTTELWVNKNHNHAIYEKGYYIHRKGATPAKKQEKGIIPGNMRDGSFLVQGLGNPKFLNSSSHGAGRALSRKDAKRKISLDDFKKSMQGIQGTISEKTLDESPMAYKDINKIMEAQKKSIKIIKYIKPLINWKG
ncbi:MAG: tRNA-splicing ligase RtcB [Candidatus Diapherotrites archaeon ADurb.Bin253]|nr:MAG: tRNA-splicing ligase RtcB [Candidatus Diapherotrites archaeon ADurb.Bin253]